MGSGKGVPAAGTRRPRRETAQALLQQAFNMARESGDLPRAAHVVEALGMTTGALYQVWPNQAAFLEDVALFIAEYPLDISETGDHPVAPSMAHLFLSLNPRWPGVADAMLANRERLAVWLDADQTEADRVLMAAAMAHITSHSTRADGAPASGEEGPLETG